MPSFTLRHLNAIAGRMPFNRLVGLRIVRQHRDGVTIECSVRDELRNGLGVLHGGVTATMADAAVGIAVVNHFEGKRAATTVEMKLNYFLPVENGKIVARARLIRTGKTLCVGCVDLFDDRKRLVAAALATYMLLPDMPLPNRVKETS
ncbi:MAG: PaaI family thioesterase [Acidobacteriota bacterium]|nr:PaaI family thioesterase [Acidobacteriota bacterium]